MSPLHGNMIRRHFSTYSKLLLLLFIYIFFLRKMCFVTFLTFLKYYATNLVYDLRIKKKKNINVLNMCEKTVSNHIVVTKWISFLKFALDMHGMIAFCMNYVEKAHVGAGFHLY